MSNALSTQQIAAIKAISEKLELLQIELNDVLTEEQEERMYDAEEVCAILDYERENARFVYDGYGDIEIEVEIPIEINPENGYSQTCYVNTMATRDAGDVLEDMEDSIVVKFPSGDAAECVDAYDARQAEAKAKAQRELEAQKEREAQQAQDEENREAILQRYPAQSETLPTEVEQVNDTEG